jgi:hypothetical protein
MSISQTGRTHTEETKEKMRIAHSGENGEFFGKTHTEEARKKIGYGNSLLTWYVNKNGDTCRSQHPLGPEWQSGRKWKP